MIELSRFREKLGVQRTHADTAGAYFHEVDAKTMMPTNGVEGVLESL